MTDLPSDARVRFRQPGVQNGVLILEGPAGSPGAFAKTFRGAWSAATGYEVGDLVTGGGSTWFALTDSTGVTPTEGAAWTEVAAGGVDGNDGVGIPAGGATGQVLKKISGTNYATEWGDVGGGDSGLLAAVSYAPTSTTVVSTSATVPTDIDATNLAITFTFPDSGRVLVKLDAMARVSTTDYIGWWCLRSGSTNVVGSNRRIWKNSPNSSGEHFRPSYSALLTGTPGSTVTYKWAHYGAGTQVSLYCGFSPGNEFSSNGSISYGAATMEVWSA